MLKKFELCPKSIRECDKWNLPYYISALQGPFHCHQEDGLKMERLVKRLWQSFRQKLVVTNAVMVAVGIISTGKDLSDIWHSWSLFSVRYAFFLFLQLCYKLFDSREHVLLFFSIYQNFQPISSGPHKYLPYQMSLWVELFNHWEFAKNAGRRSIMKLSILQFSGWY